MMLFILLHPWLLQENIPGHFLNPLSRFSISLVQMESAGLSRLKMKRLNAGVNFVSDRVLANGIWLSIQFSLLQYVKVHFYPYWCWWLTFHAVPGTFLGI